MANAVQRKPFSLRLEARLKNAELVNARIASGLSAKEVMELTGLRAYGNYERMQSYPTPETQKRLVDFFAARRIKLDAERAFPPELRELRPRKVILERELPPSRLLSLDGIDEKLLPYHPPQERAIEISADVAKLLEALPERERYVLRGIYLEGKTRVQLADELHISDGRVGQIHARALHRIRSKYIFRGQYKSLGDYLVIHRLQRS